MKIFDYLYKEAIITDFRASSKSSAIKKFCKIISQSPDVLDQKALLKDILIREEMESTGIGDGIALPHARSHGVSAPVIGVAILKKGIDFDSLDSRPIRLLIFIAVPKNHSKQLLKLLAKVTTLLKKPDLKHHLLSAQSAKDIMKLLKKE